MKKYMESQNIDLRSDTVTKPTKAMLQSIIDNFEDVGDDVYEEDKVVKELQIRLRVMFNKEDALFFPSGTMCNLTAILCWCNRGSEIILGNKSHIFYLNKPVQPNMVEFLSIHYKIYKTVHLIFNKSKMLFAMTIYMNQILL